MKPLSNRQLKKLRREKELREARKERYNFSLSDMKGKRKPSKVRMSSKHRIKLGICLEKEFYNI